MQILPGCRKAAGTRFIKKAALLTEGASFFFYLSSSCQPAALPSFPFFPLSQDEKPYFRGIDGKIGLMV
jgi:hypothetical protein